jgi:hypothetical protein
VTRRSRRPGWLILLLVLWMAPSPAAARKRALQLTLLPAISFIPHHPYHSYLSPYGDNQMLQRSYAAPLQDRFDPLGAAAALQVAYELFSRELGSGFLWLQGGVAANALIVQADDAASSVQHALIAWNVLVGGTFRLNVDHLIFADHSSRLGALFEAGLGLAGASVTPETQLPVAPGKAQAEIALVSGNYSLGLHFGVGLDYWVTRRLIIGIAGTWDVPVGNLPEIHLLRAPDGSVLGILDHFGYLGIGPRLTLRL